MLCEGVGKPVSSPTCEIDIGLSMSRHKPRTRPGLSVLIINPRGLDQMPFKDSYSVWAPEEISISQNGEGINEENKMFPLKNICWSLAH